MGIDLCLHFYLHGVNMAGWNTIERIRRLEEQIDKLGFKFAKSKHSDWSDDHGALSLKPKDHDALPIYNRDAELFIGSVERLEDWINGVRWAREYDRMLKISDDDKRAKAEQKEKNRILMRMIKEGRHVEGAVE
jgi:hypothetical protein